MNEKENIEYGTADGFLRIYNEHFGTSYIISKLSDSPDVLCNDNQGNALNLEITTTEDEEGDIKAVLGRSDHRSLEALEEHNKKVELGLESPKFISFNKVLDNLVERISAKLNKDYGSDVALIIRDSSGLDWDWQNHIEDIVSKLDLKNNPYDQGIWIISRVKDKLYKVI